MNLSLSLKSNHPGYQDYMLVVLKYVLLHWLNNSSVYINLVQVIQIIINESKERHLLKIPEYFLLFSCFIRSGSIVVGCFCNTPNLQVENELSVGLLPMEMVVHFIPLITGWLKTLLRFLYENWLQGLFMRNTRKIDLIIVPFEF